MDSAYSYAVMRMLPPATEYDTLECLRSPICGGSWEEGMVAVQYLLQFMAGDHKDCGVAELAGHAMSLARKFCERPVPPYTAIPDNNKGIRNEMVLLCSVTHEHASLWKVSRTPLHNLIDMFESASVHRSLFPSCLRSLSELMTDLTTATSVKDVHKLALRLAIDARAGPSAHNTLPDVMSKDRYAVLVSWMLEVHRDAYGTFVNFELFTTAVRILLGYALTRGGVMAVDGLQIAGLAAYLAAHKACGRHHPPQIVVSDMGITQRDLDNMTIALYDSATFASAPALLDGEVLPPIVTEGGIDDTSKAMLGAMLADRDMATRIYYHPGGASDDYVKHLWRWSGGLRNGLSDIKDGEYDLYVSSLLQDTGCISLRALAP